MCREDKDQEADSTMNGVFSRSFEGDRSVRLLCIEFEPDAGLARLAAHFASAGAAADVLRLHAGEHLPPLDRYHGMVVLGGAMNAEDDERFPFLSDVTALLRQAADRGLPVLGICLGGQLLARALGARVWRKERMELGYFRIRLTAAGRADRLFAGISGEPLALQWHEDAFDVPAGAVLLADSDRDSAQAFRFGDCYGLQFHPEVTVESVSGWCDTSRSDLGAAATPTTRESLRRRAREVEAEFAGQTACMCENWLGMVTEAARGAVH